MHILRKQTMPQRLDRYQHHFLSVPQEREKVSSSIFSKKPNESSFKTCSKMSVNIIESNSCRNLKLRKSSSFADYEMQTMIAQNRYTINLLEHNKQDKFPQISTIKKAHKLLVPHLVFEHYKQMNKSNGVYKQQLSQMMQRQQKYQRKINLPINYKIKTRKNIYEMEKKHKKEIAAEKQNIDGDNISKRNASNFTLSSQQKIQNQLIKKMIPIKRIVSFGIDERRWGLKDFFDPIVQELEVNDVKAQNMMERMNILQRLTQINSKCEEMESDSRTTQSIGVFAKYSEAVEEKLLKRKRKLQKLSFVFN